MPTTPTTRALGALTLTAALAFGAAACGTDDTSTATSSQASATEHTDADVEFASNMLEHHAQALSMVDLTEGRTLDPEVQALADDIRAAQTPEIDTFTEWLTDWNEEVPKSTDDGGHDMGDMGDSTGSVMPGMMSDDDMGALEFASDSEFQTMWLEMMVEHHTGAIEMAETETSDGQYKAAVDLAGDIVESQTVELDEMKALLDS